MINVKSDISSDYINKILKSLFNGLKVTYVSTPINTGENYIKWYNSTGKNLIYNASEYNEQRVKMVVDPNIRRAKAYISKLRKNNSTLIIDPTSLESTLVQWTQRDFYEFWDNFIKDLVSEIIFLNGWEFSVGCCHEYLSAIKYNVKVYLHDMSSLSISEAKDRIRMSIKMYKNNNMTEGNKLQLILEELDKLDKLDQKDTSAILRNKVVFKDEKLDVLVRNNVANIAQFISFEPNEDLKIRFCHINNLSISESSSVEELIKKLISSSHSGAVNIRSFSPKAMKGNALIYNKKIEDIDEIMRVIRNNSIEGKYSIVNENISINDSGVSGVALGDVIEFSPDDTPKCVDKEGVCALPRNLGLRILNTVYGFSPNLNFDHNFRIEFSIHPIRQGLKKEHTIIWEYEYFETIKSDVKISWPNRFSNFIGDKVFGLLIADALGMLVPRTTVISRKIAPFSFGTETGLNEKWIRTCPIVKEPGKYYTGREWVDPFKLMEEEEKKGDNYINIASILSQDAVEAIYSGAAFISSNERNDIIEGVAGRGDNFMVGNQAKDDLPLEVVNAVKKIIEQFRVYHNELGDISIEWVFDGANVWVVQLNQLKISFKNDNITDSRVIVPGNPIRYEKVFAREGLEVLRSKVELYKDKNIGIDLIGNIGITSHFGDVLRLANIPSKLSTHNI